MTFFLVVSVLMGLLTFSRAALINFGFSRQPERDSVDWLAGMQVAITEANELRLVPGYNFSLFVSTVPSCPSSISSECIVQANTANTDFFGGFTNLSAVLTPDWWVADGVIAAAKPYKMPVIAPKTFDHTDTEHVIFLDQRMDADIPHTLSYLFGAHECARTGLLMTSTLLTLDSVYDIQDAFVAGGYPRPPMMQFNATDAELLYFVLEEDPNRVCFIMQTTEEEIDRLMRLLKNDPRFSTSSYKLFLMASIEKSIYSIDNDTAVYDSTYVIRHAPSFRSNITAAKDFVLAFAGWRQSELFDSTDYLPTDVIPARPTELAFGSYLATRYLIELVKAATIHRRDGSVPAPHELLDISYSQRINIGSLIYYPLVRECPAPPLPQVCFCNIATKVTYTYKINGTTGEPYQLYDDSSLGQVAVADTIVSADVCSPPTIEMVNYPIIMALFLPSDGIYLEIVRQMSTMLNAVVAALNSATPAPPRKYRIYDVKATLAETDNILQERVVSRVQPFITALSMGLALNRSSTLVVFPHADYQLLEDKPLKTYEFGDENILESIGTVADYIHTLVSYYSRSPSGRYTGISAVAPSQGEATLLQKSLHTFQIDIPIDIITDESLYLATLLSHSSRSPKQFVLVSSHENQLMVAAIISSRIQSSGGVVAVATTDDYIFRFPNYAAINGDILFASILPEWWTPTASTVLYIKSTGSKVVYDGIQAGVHMASVTFAFSYLITQQATAAATSAAALLYQIGTVAVAGMTFGPFSNNTCTVEQISSNDRNRNCQCYKSARTFHVHSVINVKDGSDSTNSDRYRYTMATCGVVYQPYVPPASAVPSSSSLSTGAIIGISVGAVTAIAVLVGAVLVFSRVLFGKNTRHAPKDASQPFAMVFTDIQNSTGLWARAPAAMSASVSHHHELIRDLIAKYNGYEVKTIGDSFMVAFKNVNNAVLLAVELQSVFYEASWPTEINVTYMDLIRESVADAPENSVALESCDDVKAPLVWNGIRVRVGVHFGLGDIRKDPVSLGYDYYGTVVNTAARVEGVGHGGQVLLTEAAYSALEVGFATQRMIQVVDLGTQPLRGLDEGVQLRQLQAIRFSARRFPALRLDVENVAAGDEGASDISELTDDIPADQMAQRLSTTHGVNCDPETVLRAYNFLTVGIAAGTEKWKKGVIKELGKLWRVEMHSSANGPSMRSLMMIAIKIDRAARSMTTAAVIQHASTTAHAFRANTNNSFIMDAEPTIKPFQRDISNDASAFSVSSHVGGSVPNHNQGEVIAGSPNLVTL